MTITFPTSGLTAPTPDVPTWRYLDTVGGNRRFVSDMGGGGEIGPLINVVTDYGADPTGQQDSYAAIQNAFDDAFGSRSRPNGNSGPVNMTVYFPAGHYRIAGGVAEGTITVSIQGQADRVVQWTAGDVGQLYSYGLTLIEAEDVVVTRIEALVTATAPRGRLSLYKYHEDPEDEEITNWYTSTDLVAGIWFFYRWGQPSVVVTRLEVVVTTPTSGESSIQWYNGAWQTIGVFDLGVTTPQILIDTPRAFGEGQFLLQDGGSSSAGIITVSYKPYTQEEVGVIDLSTATSQVLADAPLPVTSSESLYVYGMISTGSLTITNAHGGKLLGDGMDQTVLSYEGALDIAQDGVWLRACIWMRVLQFEITGISFVNTTALSDPRNPVACCIAFISGYDWREGVGGNANVWRHCSFKGGRYAFIAGFGQHISENTFFGCRVEQASQFGFSTHMGNTLNFQLFGGYLRDCGFEPELGGETGQNTAALYADFSTIVLLCGVAFENNYQDINQMGFHGTVIACRSQDSGAFITFLRYYRAIGCYQVAEMAEFTASVDWDEMTVHSVESGTIRIGMGVEGGTYRTRGWGYTMHTRIMRQLSSDEPGGAPGGRGVYQTSAPPGIPTPDLSSDFASQFGPTTVRAYPIFITPPTISGFDNCAHSGFSVIRQQDYYMGWRGVSDNFDTVPGYGRQPFSGPRYPVFWTGMTPSDPYSGGGFGQLTEFSYAGMASIPVSRLPPNPIPTGVSIAVHDLQYPAEGNYGRPVLASDGGGTNVVRVFSPGGSAAAPGNWRVGGG